MNALEINPEYHIVNKYLGDLFYYHQDYGESEKYYLKIPEDAEPQLKRATYIRLGKLYYKIYSDFEKTADCFLKAYEVDTSNILSLLNLIEIYTLIGDFDTQNIYIEKAESITDSNLIKAILIFFKLCRFVFYQYDKDSYKYLEDEFYKLASIAEENNIFTLSMIFEKLPLNKEIKNDLNKYAEKIPFRSRSVLIDLRSLE